jgi:hypothetical protein
MRCPACVSVEVGVGDPVMPRSGAQKRRLAAEAISAQISALRLEPLDSELVSAFTSSDALEYLEEVMASKGGVKECHIQIAVRFLTVGIHAGAAIEAADLLNHLSPDSGENVG